MATYNGEKYVKEQLKSILDQLEDGDELIIVDDCSTDKTFRILNSYTDQKIKVFQNPKNVRHVKTFAKAMSLAENDLIFLADQDDVWAKGRIQLFKKYFDLNPDAEVITSNFECINAHGEFIDNTLNKVTADNSKNYGKNIADIFLGRVGYYGCAMAFKKSILPIVLPIPKFVEAHDLWIAMLANVRKTNIHISEKTLYHRMHGNNASDLKRRLIIKIYARLNLLKAYLTCLKRMNKIKSNQLI